MRYVSVCSGIEAATVAWHHLGWTPVAFSEIEPFPSAVLAHHYSNVPNFGDMTKFQEWPIEPGTVDLLVGGTPCQSFSVAGLRKGISDPRGGLMLTYLEIARRFRPRWIVWENVPGVLSSGGGRDFGSLLGGLEELGYGWAYRVLDAQWVRTQRHPRAVPQRRRRVFVVGCLGDWERAAAVLFKRQSVQRDFTKKRTETKRVAADAEAGAGAGCYLDGGDIANTLTRKGCDDRMPDKDRLFAVLQPVAGTIGNRGLRSQTELDGHGAYIPVQQPTIVDDVCPTLSLFDQGETRATTVAIAFKPGQSAEARTIGAQVDVACTLEAGGGGNNKQAVAHALAVRTAQTSANGHGIAEGVSHTLDQAQGQAVAHAMTVRRLTPRECERLQGFPDDWTLIPWRGRPADQCPDGPRYKALGNSMAVNCMAWIGERIAAVDSRHDI